jgi:amidase
VAEPDAQTQDGKLRPAEPLAALAVTANLLGLPAAAVLTGEAGGLPQGVQVVGPRFGDELCLDAAEAIERALGTITPIDPR